MSNHEKQARTLDLAIQIADAAVRSDVELYARRMDVEGTTFYDVAMGADSAQDVETVQRAMEYIVARGDVFPWNIVRHISSPNLVSFREKDVVNGS